MKNLINIFAIFLISSSYIFAQTNDNDCLKITENLIKDPNKIRTFIRDTNYCSNILLFSMSEDQAKFIIDQINSFNKKEYYIDSSISDKKIIINENNKCLLKMVYCSNSISKYKLFVFSFYKINSENWKLLYIDDNENNYLEENFIENINLNEPIDKINQIIKDPNNITHLELEYYDLINKKKNQKDAIWIKKVQNIANEYVNNFKSYPFKEITEFVLNFGELEKEEIPFITITLCNKKGNKLVFQFVSRDLLNWKFLFLNNEEELSYPQ